MFSMFDSTVFNQKEKFQFWYFQRSLSSISTLIKDTTGLVNIDRKIQYCKRNFYKEIFKYKKKACFPEFLSPPPPPTHTHTGIWCDTSPRRGLCHSLMPDYACRCPTSTLIMHQSISSKILIHLKKKIIFLAQKLKKLEQF